MADQFFTVHPSGKEKFLFISDLHGANPKVKTDVTLQENPNIKWIFSTGDIIGTDTLTKLHPLFYNVYNLAKTALNSKPDTTDVELFNYNTTSKELARLINFLGEIGNTELQLSGEQIRELANYAHFGHFASCLNVDTRNILRQGLENNASILMNYLSGLAKQYGINIYLVEGNWDARTPIDFYPVKNQCIPIPKEKRKFYLGNFIRQNEVWSCITYIDKPKVVYDHDHHIAFVLWPFDSSTTPQMVPEIKYDDYKVVLVSHSHILWHPVKGNTPRNSENSNIEENMTMVLQDLHADTAVHGHLHTQLPNGYSGYIVNGKLVHYLPLGEVRAIAF